MQTPVDTSPKPLTAEQAKRVGAMLAEKHWKKLGMADRVKLDLVVDILYQERFVVVYYPPEG